MSNYRERFNEMYGLGYDSAWSNKEIPQEVRNYIQQLTSEGILDIEKSRIIDIGCGRGRLLRYFEQEGFSQIVGADVSEVAASFVSQHTERSEVVVADAIKGLPFENNSFSLATELTVLSSLNPQVWPAILSEIYRILDIGSFYISEVFARDKSYSLFLPLVTRSVIPREIDQVYGVTRSEIDDIFGKQFSIKSCQPINHGPSSRFFVLAQKLQI